MSAFPSLLKSPAPFTCHEGPALPPTTFPELGKTIHRPDCDLAAGILPKNVGVAVAVKIPRTHSLPRSSGVTAYGAAGKDRTAIQEPDRGLTVRVLPKQILRTITLEVAALKGFR